MIAFRILVPVVVVAGLAATGDANPIELRVATLAPDGSPWMAVFNQEQAEVAKKTQGRVALKFYPGGQQGDEADFVRKIGLGQLDGAAITATGLSMIDESIRVLELPRMFKSIEELDYVADKMWPYFQKKFEAKGYKLNDRGEVGWVHFLTKNKVDSTASLKSHKLWLWSNDKIVSATYGKLALNGVPLGVPDVDPGLTSGKINGAYGSPLAFVSLQWYSKGKFMTSMPMSFAIGATVMSTKSVAKLTAADQKDLETIGKANAKKLRKVIRKSNDDAKATMVRKGITIVDTPAAMVGDFDKAAEQVWKDLVGKVYSQQELDMVLKYRAEYRAKHP